jgi:DNA-binding Lrp family transcriptional regulator
LKDTKCSAKSCTECGKKLRFFEGYAHPTLGKKKCVCKTCWEKLKTSQTQYSKFLFHALNDEKGTPCFLLINTLPRHEKQVYTQLSNLNEISEVYPLLGKPDLLAKVQMKDYHDLSLFVLNRLRTIEGVKNTQTLTGAVTLKGVKQKKE